MRKYMRAFRSQESAHILPLLGLFLENWTVHYVENLYKEDKAVNLSKFLDFDFDFDLLDYLKHGLKGL